MAGGYQYNGNKVQMTVHEHKYLYGKYENFRRNSGEARWFGGEVDQVVL